MVAVKSWEVAFLFISVFEVFDLILLVEWLLWRVGKWSIWFIVFSKIVFDLVRPFVYLCSTRWCKFSVWALKLICIELHWPIIYGDFTSRPCDRIGILNLVGHSNGRCERSVTSGLNFFFLFLLDPLLNLFDYDWKLGVHKKIGRFVNRSDLIRFVGF